MGLVVQVGTFKAGEANLFGLFAFWVLERGDVRRHTNPRRGGPRDIEDEFVAHPEGGGVILLSARYGKRKHAWKQRPKDA